MFNLQIVDGQGVVVTLPGGGQLEADLIATCTKAILARGMADVLGGPGLQRAFLRAATDGILAKGVGLFTTQAHVKRDIEAGLNETLTAFLFMIERDTAPVVADGLKDAIQALKSQTRRVV